MLHWIRRPELTPTTNGLWRSAKSTRAKLRPEAIRLVGLAGDTSAIPALEKLDARATPEERAEAGRVLAKLRQLAAERAAPDSLVRPVTPGKPALLTPGCAAASAHAIGRNGSGSPPRDPPSAARLQGASTEPTELPANRLRWKRADGDLVCAGQLHDRNDLAQQCYAIPPNSTALAAAGRRSRAGSSSSAASTRTPTPSGGVTTLCGQSSRHGLTFPQPMAPAPQERGSS